MRLAAGRFVGQQEGSVAGEVGGERGGRLDCEKWRGKAIRDVGTVLSRGARPGATGLRASSMDGGTNCMVTARLRPAGW